MVFFFSFIIFRTFFVKKKKTKEKEKTERKAFSLPIPLPTFPYYLLEPLLPFLLGVARAGADLFVSMGKERGGGIFILFSVGVEREKKKKREAFVFSPPLFSLSSLLPLPSSFLLRFLSHREQGELLYGRARARVPRLGHRFFYSWEGEREFFLSIDRLCRASFFSLSFCSREGENLKGGNGNTLLFLEESVPLRFSTKGTRARVCVTRSSLVSLEREKERGASTRKEERGRRQRRRCRRRRRHEGDDDWLFFPSLSLSHSCCSSPFFALLLFRAHSPRTHPRNAKAER